MTCIHINQANQQLKNLILMTYNIDSEIFDQKLYTLKDSISAHHDGGVFSCDYWSSYTDPIKIIDIVKIGKKIDRVEKLLNLCNCKENESSQADLRVETERIRKELAEIESKKEQERNERERTREREDSRRQLDYERDQNSLVRAQLDGARREITEIKSSESGLRTALGLTEQQVEQLQTRLGSVEGRLQISEALAERLRGALLFVATENAQNQLRANIYETRFNQTEDQLTLREVQLESLRDSGNNLGIIIANQEFELRQIRQELARTQAERDERITPLDLLELTQGLQIRDEEIERLKRELSRTKEASLEQKLGAKESKLERLTDRYYLTRVQLEAKETLIEAYKELEKAKKERDGEDIDFYQSFIRETRQLILGDNVDIDTLQEIADLCQEIAKLQHELSQPYQAQVEVPAY